MSRSGSREQALPTLRDHLLASLTVQGDGPDLAEYVKHFVHERAEALGQGGLIQLERVAEAVVWSLIAEYANDQVSQTAALAKRDGVSWRTLAAACGASSTAAFIRQHDGRTTTGR